LRHYFDRKKHSLPFVVEHKLSWAGFSNADEAHYLVAFLNSEAANDLIKLFQSTGLLALGRSRPHVQAWQADHEAIPRDLRDELGIPGQPGENQWEKSDDKLLQMG
jgi:hypothetical protein